ncbi:uncharacterized protein LOC142635141 [Castanea sativa]|uniref:uncharacterized protein LOC142635141 n=1 Tax=Castanea sativa TaxID=21020 RepID=UPI003F64BEAF
MSTTQSTWPVVLVPYNLPPWMCMKRSSLILSLVIPGPTSPGIAIDTYLQPLVEELRELWDVGVESFDASSNTRFQLRAALIWTINDFPAYADISGWSTKGLFACPSCMFDTESYYLKHGQKVCYMGHRRWLDNDHEFREDDINFEGTKEFRVAPMTPSGLEIMRDAKNLVGRCPGKKHQALYNKRKKGEEDACVWKKRSILFTLLYWADQKLCHNIDVMHTKKNVTDNIMATLLDLAGKTKDTYRARLDLKAMGIRSELHLVHKGVDKVEMPVACYNMTTSEKHGFLQVLKDVRVPDGYASNISRRVHLKERRISGLKSHDDHILIQQLLPIALRRSLPSQVIRPLIKLSCYFHEICSKTLTVLVLENLGKDIAATLCKLEKIFPPSFFTVMVHVVMHLAREAKFGRPVHYRWMYPIESMHKHVIEDELRKAHRRITDGVIHKHYMEKFCGWFRDLVMSMSDADRQKLSVTLSTIGACPYSRAKRMKHYVTNGLKFRTKDSEKNKKTQNSGVDIHSSRGYKIDELGFPLVNFTRLIHVGDELMDELYVLASEASQVFYVEDKRDKDWFVVVKTKARDVFDAGSGPLCEDDDGDTYCENVPYNIIGDNAASDNIGLARPDVQGITIDAMVIKENEKAVNGDFIDDNDFIDDDYDNNEEYSDNEYNDD